MTEKDLKNYKLPAHLRKKDGYWHVIIEAKHPITKEKIRHSQSTKLKVIEKTRRKSEENETEARIQLKKFQKKWSDYYFSGVRENEVENIFFTDYLKNWLNSIKSRLQPSTVRGYSTNIEKTVIPYFEPKKFLLTELKARHIQEFYTYCLTEKKANPNTVIRYHANIRKCLQTALKQELVLSNQADLVDKPKKKSICSKSSFYFKIINSPKEH